MRQAGPLMLRIGHSYEKEGENMTLKNILNVYHLLLSLGAFYMGITMISNEGIFESFPEEWAGKLPFSDWMSLALFGMIVFGIGNGGASVYGFIKKDKTIFTLALVMGALFLFCIISPTVLLGEWYLPTAQFLIAAIIQLLLGASGFLTEILKRKKIH